MPTAGRLVLPSGAAYEVRAAGPSDAQAVTDLIHSAFETWKRDGLRLSPMSQTVEETRRHLDGKGMVAFDVSGALAGTFSLEDGRIEAADEGILVFHEGRETVQYERMKPPELGPRLVFKKAAVAPGHAQAGLGRALYDLAERAAREAGYPGMALETVAEAAWLYDWYLRLGFTPVGRCRYPGSALDTLLMVKDFA